MKSRKCPRCYRWFRPRLVHHQYCDKCAATIQQLIFWGRVADTSPPRPFHNPYAGAEE